MNISIVIVNWNSGQLAADCIQSIAACAGGRDYEVIVVDNASSDGSAKFLTERFGSSIKLLALDQNIGFARANNLGFERSQGDIVLFLNPDTVVRPQAIDLMASCMRSDSRIGVVGCRLLNADLTLQTSSVQPRPTIWNQLFAIDLLMRRWPKLSLWGMQALYSGHGHTGQDVDVVSGACLMARRDVFEQVGCFGTEYFMYAEEVDFCWKVHNAGYRISHIGAAEVVHLGGQSSKQRGDTFSEIVMRESLYKLFRKFHGSLYANLYRGLLLLSAAIRMAGLMPLMLLPGGLVDRNDLSRTFRKWWKIACWCLALETGAGN